MSMYREKRQTIMNFKVTDSEAAAILEKMKTLGIRNLSAYLRSMVLNGSIVRLDLPEIREMIRLLSNMTNNLNQIAKRVNAHGNIYETEIDELREKQQELWLMMRKLLSRLDTA